jgi:hypothetical protein
MRSELPLHDAAFDGIVTSGKNVTLYFTQSSGVGCAVTLNEVSHLQLNDFRQGNVVILFEITSGEAPKTDIAFERLFGSPHPSAPPEHHAQSAEFVRSTLDAIEAGSLTFVEMQPAYGADLLAVCRSVELVEH